MSILSFLLFSIPTGLAINEKSRPIEITKDVVIIGGGASGTYAAVRLREDLGKSVIVIEPRPNLGGHTSTYLIPETNTTVDYGVQSYLPYGPASSFFARFNITTEVFSPERLNSLNVDVETGKTLLDYRAPSLNATNEALSRWLTITQKYQQYLEPGYWNFPRPGDIPDDFLIPFEQFAKREGIEAAVPRITAISGVGYGGVRDLLTLTVFQAFGASLTQGKSRQLLSPDIQELALTLELMIRFPAIQALPPNKQQQRPPLHPRPLPPKVRHPPLQHRTIHQTHKKQYPAHRHPRKRYFLPDNYQEDPLYRTPNPHQLTPLQPRQAPKNPLHPLDPQRRIRSYNPRTLPPCQNLDLLPAPRRSTNQLPVTKRLPLHSPPRRYWPCGYKSLPRRLRRKLHAFYA